MEVADIVNWVSTLIALGIAWNLHSKQNRISQEQNSIQQRLLDLAERETERSERERQQASIVAEIDTENACLVLRNSGSIVAQRVDVEELESSRGHGSALTKEVEDYLPIPFLEPMQTFRVPISMEIPPPLNVGISWVDPDGSSKFRLMNLSG
jgi:hypothetical protein